MDRDHQISRIVLATGMIALGILGIVYGDFAMQWQPVPASVPFRTGLAYVVAIVMLAGGIALLFRRTTAIATRVLFAYLVLWVLLKAGTLIAAPLVEASWLGVGEIVVLMTGGWSLFARYADLPEGSWLRFAAGARGIRSAQLLFGAALIPIGLSHIVYVPQTAALVPAWLPDRIGWAYLTGAGQIAAGLGVLFSILPRVAAAAEASMLTLFTFLVWAPAVVAAPATRLPWTALCMSWTIAASAWVVAGSMPRAARPAVDEPVVGSQAI